MASDRERGDKAKAVSQPQRSNDASLLLATLAGASQNARPPAEGRFNSMPVESLGECSYWHCDDDSIRPLRFVTVLFTFSRGCQLRIGASRIEGTRGRIGNA